MKIVYITVYNTIVTLSSVFKLNMGQQFLSKRVDLDQTALYEQSYIGLHCLPTALLKLKIG